jgi:WD40 repeat protein
MLTGLWDGEIRLWTLPDGNYQGMIAGLVNQIQAMSFAHHQPDHVAVAAGSFLTVWEVPSGRRIATVKEPDMRSISTLAYSSGAPWLICGMTNGSLRIRDASQPDYPVINEILVHRSAVHQLACLSNPQRVASISHYDTATVSDILHGETLFDLKGHEDAVLCIAASATEPVIVTGGADGTVRLWDASSGTPLAVLTGHGRPVSRVAVSPDTRVIASADSGGTIRLWRAG